MGVRQSECLSPFLFAMYINDMEQELENNGVNGIDIGMFKLLLLLYADDIVLFGNTSEELQKSLDVLEEYCDRWRLTVNTSKTKILISTKGGRLSGDLQFKYKGNPIEIVKKILLFGNSFYLRQFLFRNSKDPFRTSIKGDFYTKQIFAQLHSVKSSSYFRFV